MGLVLLTLSAIALVGIQFQKRFMLRTVTIVMTCTSVVLILAALLLGMSSGVGDLQGMDYYYKTNWESIKDAIEGAEIAADPDSELPLYCQMKKSDCEALTYDVDGSKGVYPQRCLDDNENGEYGGGECVEIVTTKDFSKGADYQMTAEEIWERQHAVAAEYYDSDRAEYAWLEACKSTPVCIYCDEFFKSMEATPAGYESDAPPETATCTETASTSVEADAAACGGVTDLGTAAACEAVQKTSGGGSACTYRGAKADCVAVNSDDASACDDVKDSTALETSTACDAIGTCTADDGTDSCDSYSYDNCGGADGCSWSASCRYKTRDEYKLAQNLDWIDTLAGEGGDTLITHTDIRDPARYGKLKKYEEGVVAVDKICVPTDGVDASSQDDKVRFDADKTTCSAVKDDALDDSTACDDTGSCSYYARGATPATSAGQWTETIEQFTTVHDATAEAMPRCRFALSEYTKDSAACPAEDTAPDEDKGTYKEDCKSNRSQPP